MSWPAAPRGRRARRAASRAASWAGSCALHNPTCALRTPLGTGLPVSFMICCAAVFLGNKGTIPARGCRLPPRVGPRQGEGWQAARPGWVGGGSSARPAVNACRTAGCQASRASAGSAAPGPCLYHNAWHRPGAAWRAAGCAAMRLPSAPPAPFPLPTTRDAPAPEPGPSDGPPHGAAHGNGGTWLRDSSRRRTHAPRGTGEGSGGRWWRRGAAGGSRD